MSLLSEVQSGERYDGMPFDICFDEEGEPMVGDDEVTGFMMEMVEERSRLEPPPDQEAV